MSRFHTIETYSSMLYPFLRVHHPLVFRTIPASMAKSYFLTSKLSKLLSDFSGITTYPKFAFSLWFVTGCFCYPVIDTSKQRIIFDINKQTCCRTYFVKVSYLCIIFKSLEIR